MHVKTNTFQTTPIFLVALGAIACWPPASRELMSELVAEPLQYFCCSVLSSTCYSVNKWQEIIFQTLYNFV